MSLSRSATDLPGDALQRLQEENDELRIRLQEAEETLVAIRQGDVDALVVGADIYTLDSSHAAAGKLRQDVLAQMEDAVLAFDGDDNLTFMNEAAERHYGQGASDLLGRPKAQLFEEVWPSDGDRESCEQALRDKGLARAQVLHRLPGGGSAVNVEIALSVLRDVAGNATGRLYVIRDIEERVKAEQSLAAAAGALARRERQFSTLVENSPDIFARMDRSHRHLYVSPIVTHYTGADPSRFLGKTNAELGMPDHLVREWQVALDGVFQRREIGRVQFAFDAVDGRKAVFDARLVPEFDEQGAVESVLSIAVDVTEQERVNEDLRESQARLREADMRKDEFLATLAHELRNPLAPIRNALQLMRMSQRPEVHADARGVVERQLGQMVHLVDDLLDISRISRGKLDLRREVADMTAIVQSAVETSRPLIEAGRHQLTVQLPQPQSLLVHADVTRLCQVIANLLNNAAKYTPEAGRIELVARRQDDWAVVEVRDSGAGIPPDMLPRVFEMFTQVDRTIGRSQGGLGIGLALVHKLVDLHGGQVEASSEGPGRGSTFTVRLPLAPHADGGARGSDARPVQPVSATGQRVLVVDDNVDSALTMAQVLEMLGYETAMAHDGLEALALAESFRPEVLLLDIGLPLLSGHDVARRIRAQDWGRDMLLIALSGWGQEADKHKSVEAGFDHHFVKPVDLDALMKAVSAPAARRS
ncbi:MULTISPECIES: ATP-binding protein [Ramlibacter]|uniref:histidine kinase n=1 Tax=Ramlibacter pinisoli TaxID=2682844 RepID=A0A6N8IVV4_9BURK|nr:MULTISPECIES: ATP-binding protein [Ramlibacter]MBA2961147.1 PAS domain S-box protein [Ramlibacter sp. CGMCC 1.13660]MVQ31091.1 PAS domain S-box protein [Ramlibacter pinisoli]